MKYVIMCDGSYTTKNEQGKSVEFETLEQAMIEMNSIIEEQEEAFNEGDIDHLIDYNIKEI